MFTNSPPSLEYESLPAERDRVLEGALVHNIGERVADDSHICVQAVVLAPARFANNYRLTVHAAVKFPCVALLIIFRRKQKARNELSMKIKPRMTPSAKVRYSES